MTQDNPDWQQGVNIEEADVNSVPIDIVAQAIGNVAVDIAAQSLATLGIDIEAQSIDVDTNIASQSVTLDMNLTASSATVDTNITGQNVTLNTDIAAQSIQDLAVDVTAQTLSNLDINVNAQDIGVADAGQFAAENGNSDTDGDAGTASANGSGVVTIHTNNSGSAQVAEVLYFSWLEAGTEDARVSARIRDSNDNLLASAEGQPKNTPFTLDPGVRIPDGGDVHYVVENFTGSALDFGGTVLFRQL